MDRLIKKDPAITVVVVTYGSWIYNYLYMQSMPITTKVVSSNLAHGIVYSIKIM
jgi:hypothetical protein